MTSLSRHSAEGVAVDLVEGCRVEGGDDPHRPVARTTQPAAVPGRVDGPGARLGRRGRGIQEQARRWRGPSRRATRSRGSGRAPPTTGPARPAGAPRGTGSSGTTSTGTGPARTSANGTGSAPAFHSAIPSPCDALSTAPAIVVMPPSRAYAAGCLAQHGRELGERSRERRPAGRSCRRAMPGDELGGGRRDRSERGRVVVTRQSAALDGAQRPALREGDAVGSARRCRRRRAAAAASRAPRRGRPPGRDRRSPPDPSAGP